MLKSRALLIALTGCIVGIVIAVVRMSSSPAASPAPTATLAATPVEVASAQPAAAPTAARVATMPGAPASPASVDDVVAEHAPTDVLVAGLDSEDPIVVAEAANALVGRGAVDVLPVLVEEDVIARPKAAPSLIYAMGRLAAKAGPKERAAAVDRLLALMAEEKKRGAQESQGNLLQIYEALGDTGDARAIAPLERELLDASVATAPKVVVVQALVALRATQSRPTLEKLAAQLASSTKTGFEAELEHDLLAVIREALVRLS
jgi:hypothetical protein